MKKALLFIFVLLISIASASAFNLTDLLLYAKLNTDLTTDSSPFAKTAINSGGVVASEAVKFLGNASADFDDSENWPLNFTSGGTYDQVHSFTFGCWSNGSEDGSQNNMFGRYPGGKKGAFRLMYRRGTPDIRVLFFHSNVASTSAVASSFTMADNYNYYAVQVNITGGTAHIYLWLNDSVIAQANVAYTFASLDSDVMIGGADGSNGWDGSADDCSYWNTTRNGLVQDIWAEGRDGFELDFDPDVITFSADTINDTSIKQGDTINVGINLSAGSNISGYIFSIDNGSGIFVNGSFVSVTPSTSIKASINTTIVSAAGQVVKYTWYGNVTTTGKISQSSEFSFIVENVSLDDCSSFNTTSLNFTFFDEQNNSIVSANADATFNYQFGTLLDKTLILDEDNNISFDVCINPSTVTLTGDYKVFYSSSVYPQRRFHDTEAVYNNQKQTINLYLLEASQGIFIRFKTVRTSGTPLSDSKIIMQKVIAGSLVTVEIELTDDSGVATFFADPDSDYTFIVSKSGFIPQTFTLRPTSTEIITVTLLAIGETQSGSIDIGVSYFFEPINGVLSNGTSTNFTFNMTSSSLEINACTLFIKNQTATLATQTGTFNGTQCTVRIEFNTGNHSIIISEAHWQLNNTNNATASVQYNIIFTYVGDFSLQTLINDISDFGESGFNDFTRFFFSFVGIFAIITLASMDSRGKGLFINKKEDMLLLIWFSVFFFSFIGWMTINLQAIPEIKGVTDGWLKQYLVFMLTTLGIGGFLFKRN